MQRPMVVAVIAGVLVFSRSIASAAYHDYQDELPSGDSEAACFSAANGYVAMKTGSSAYAKLTTYAFTTNDVNSDIHATDPNTGKPAGTVGAWAETAPKPHAGKKYYVGSGKSLCTQNDQGREVTFAGDQLVVGANGKLHSMSVAPNFSRIDDLYMLGGSKFVWTGNKSPLLGNVRFRRCDANPVRFVCNCALRQPFAMVADGSADARIDFFCDADKPVNTAFVLTNDWSRYQGSMTISNLFAGVGGSTTLAVQGPSFPATVTVAEKGVFELFGKGNVSVGALDMRGGSLKIEQGTSVSCGRFSTTARVPLALTFREQPEILTTWTALSAPKGAFTADDFEIDALPGWADVQVKTVGSRTSVDVSLSPKIVTLLFTRSGATGSPFYSTNGVCWSDGRLPHPGSDYLATGYWGFYLAPGTEDYAFPGDKLTLAGGLSMNAAGGSAPRFICADLCLSNALIRTWSHDFCVSGGRIRVDDTARLVHYGGRTSVFSVESVLEGSGLLLCDSYISAQESGSCGQIALLGNNSKFLGKIRVTIPSDASHDYGPVPSDARSTTLHFAAPDNLGGALSVFTPDALELEQMSILKPSGTMTYKTKNRGLRVSGLGRIAVPPDATFTWANPITYAGLLRKEGAGTLAISGQGLKVSGGQHSIAAGLEVVAGALKPASTNCLDGIPVAVKGGAKLVFDINPAWALNNWGVVGFCEQDGADEIIPIGFDTASNPSEPPKNYYYLALFTVPNARVESLLPRLRLEKAYPEYAEDIMLRDNSNGTTTVRARFVRRVYTIDAATCAKTLPIFKAGENGVATVPNGVHLEFTGFGEDELASREFVIARGDKLDVPTDFGDWTSSPTLKDLALSVEVRGTELVVRFAPREKLYALAKGLLAFTGIGIENSFDPIFVTTNSAICKSNGRLYPGSDNSYSFSNETGRAGVYMNGRLTVDPLDLRKARATWTFVPTDDIAAANGLCVWNYMKGAQFVGWTLTYNDTSVVLPASWQKTTLFDNSRVTRLVFADAKGVVRMRLDFPEPIRVMLRDMRKDGDYLELRIYYPKTTGFVKGESYKLLFDVSAPVEINARNPTVEIIDAADGGWVPLTESEYVKPGSALDFSDVCRSGKPAGRHGRVMRVGDHFEFANLPGVEQRFFGVTKGASQYVYEPDARDQGLADLARRGYNATRVHDYESGVVNKEDPGQTTFDPQKIDLFDGYIASAISNGLYFVLELYGNHRTPSWRSIGEDRDGAVTRDEAKMLLMVHEGMISNHMDYVRNYLTRKNRYTGRSFVEEPALIGVSLINELFLGFSRVQDVGAQTYDDIASAWRKWLAAKRAEAPTTYGEIPDALPKNFTSTFAGRVYLQFVREQQMKTERRMRRFLREELGLKAAITDFNDGFEAAFATVQDECHDYTDMHYYEDHPSWLEETSRLPFTYRHRNLNPIICGRTVTTYAACKGVPLPLSYSFYGRPFVMSEYNYCSPGRYRFAGGLLLGAVAGLQAMDGLWQHSYAFKKSASRMGNFDYLSDPLMPMWSRAVLALFARRDMTPLSRHYVTRLDPDALCSTDERAKAGLRASATPATWAAWYARLGSVVSKEIPEGVLTSGDWPTTLAKTEADVMTDLGIRRDADGKLPLAGDGQVRIDDVDGSIMIDTPRTSGGFAERGVIDGGALKATISGEEPTAIWVSALDGKPIASSRHLLLSHLVDVQDQGLTYLAGPGEDRRVQLTWGELPHLMRRASAEVEISVGKGCVFVYALSTDGTRRFAVPCSVKDGKVRFTANTAADPSEATALYEIVRRIPLSVQFR